MRRAAWLHQFNKTAEQTPQQFADTLLPRGINALYVKACDGSFWMGDVYSHPLVPRDLDSWGQVVAAFRDVGLTLMPWVVNRRSASEAALHLACGKIAGGLIVDFEFLYDGFWEGPADPTASLEVRRHQAANEAVAYFNQMRGAVAGGDWVAVAPDPRQLDRDYGIWQTIGQLSSYLPQTYWTDFKADALDVVIDSVQRLAQFGPVQPILPHNAQPADMQRALEWCAGRGLEAVSLWVMGPANATELDAFAMRVAGEEGPTDVNDAERAQMQNTINGLVTTVADIADRIGDEILTETNRKSMRKTVLREKVAQMQAERAQAVGPRPT